MSGATEVSGVGRSLRPAVMLAPAAVAALVVVAGWAALRGAEPGVGFGMPDPPSSWMVVAAPVLRLVVTEVGGTCLGLLVSGRHATDRALSWTGVLAAAWAGAAFLGSVLLVVLQLGRGGLEVLGRPTVLLHAMVTFGEPAAMLLAAAIGAVVTVVVGLRESAPPVGVAALAAVGVLAPAVTGPTTRTGTGHDLVTDAAVFATLAGAVWLGVTVHGLIDGAGFPGAGCTQRAVTAGAVTLAATLLGAAVLVQGEWLASLHGRWAGLQVVLLGCALVLTLRRAGPAPVVATLLAAAAAGAAAVIEPPPALLLPATMQQMMVGFDVPERPSALGLAAPGRLDLLWAVVGVTLAVGYVLRWRRAGDRRRSRLVCWLAGCALLVVTTSSTLGALSMAVFSAHMAVHMVLAVLVPLFLVLGGPLTLVDRAPLDTPAVRVLTHPAVSLTVFVGSMLVLYNTPLFAAILPSHWAHQVLAAVVLVSGYAFLWPIVGVDPAPRPLPHVARLALLLASMPFHAFFGVALLGATEVIGATYYERLEVSWVGDLLADQRLGAMIAWGAAEASLLGVLAIVLVRWGREDRRPGHAGPSPWDAMVADLARRR
ncbi:cytochrome c oxidase assembly protein [Actinomycetospora termitidis]|uniref:Cytochrome c oxidase assembly protein n=1 Tax=Actinomycetospora termitidis TaxID=3053470 RepID=A0ABT7MCG4_9PSEU|nr:cytochrome c oxidase assembly protein [Actinomycetospora sp. Odt1-22]MDL5158363.1 cytochrome c oxidase assembly protein [Actinomycetospora sp. Odt1-22]